MPAIIVIKDKKTAKHGAVLGGIALVPTALVINLAAYANIDVLQYAERLILGALMGLALFGMMTLSMAVPCLYTVCAASYRRIICCIGLYLNKTARFTALVCR